MPQSTFDDDSFSNEDSNNTIKNITVNKYYGNLTESVCQIKNFILSRDNILEWYDPFKKRYLMAKSP
ncbi:hypothetical protein H8356DRAFT_1345317 [Neocallimastix lanati (nom. inval.)]|nr:hypothetical protein H8356DRAFT_1345317 [Neocallimastix sp. JGI-2020a]